MGKKYLQNRSGIVNPCPSYQGRCTLRRRSPRTWMRLVVHRQDVLHGELGVALGGREPLVPERLLDGPQVGAFFEQVGAESVTQSVRMDVRR